FYRALSLVSGRLKSHSHDDRLVNDAKCEQLLPPNMSTSRNVTGKSARHLVYFLWRLSIAFAHREALLPERFASSPARIRREEESNGRRRFLMRAIVLEHAGPPEVLEIRNVPRPEPRPGWVLIQVKAFGLNRSELFTRQGYSPGVTFPR